MRDLGIPGLAFSRLYESVDSTMSVAREAVAEITSTAASIGLIAALQQTAGRGRQGRSWQSTGESFLGTFVIRTSLSRHELAGYSLAFGVMVSEAFSRIGAPLQLKWPNDLVLTDAEYGYRKFGGILIEVEETADSRVLLVGIGLNLGEPPADVPRAGGVRSSFGVDVKNRQVALSLSESLLREHAVFERAGVEAFVTGWNSRSLFRPGDPLSMDLGTEMVEGVFEGISHVGAATLRTPAGLREIYSGHVTAWNGIPLT